MSQAGIEMQSVAAPHSSNSVTNHRVHDLQILNCPSPLGLLRGFGERLC